MSGVLSNLTILLVEDEREIKELMAKILQSVCAKVITAQNGDEGLKKFKKFNPDIVISDILMPIMDGLEMAKSIKQISRDTPIVVLSAFSEKERLLRAIDVGIDKYILKPIDIDEFLLTLKLIATQKLESTNIIKLTNGFSFNKIRRVLVRDDKEVALTKKELAFISLLAKRPGSLIFHDEIKSVVWGGESVTDTAIRTFVKRVRDKIGVELVKNVPGLGYKIEI